jgi:exosortase H (IPTLxxWG-CTERM-specific)
MGKSRKASGKKTGTSKPTKTGQPKKKKPADPRKRRLILFIFTFLGLLVVGAIVYPWFSISMDNELRGLMAVTASICGGFLDLFSADVIISGRFVTFKGFSVEIIEECTGLFEMLIFLAAVLSYPASWKSRGIGIALGIPALYLINVARIIFLIVVGYLNNSLFEFMHLYFWQATLILMITTVWVLWILLVVNREKKSASLLA